jgi:hypothetical protein
MTCYILGRIAISIISGSIHVAVVGWLSAAIAPLLGSVEGLGAGVGLPSANLQVSLKKAQDPDRHSASVEHGQPPTV